MKRIAVLCLLAPVLLAGPGGSHSMRPATLVVSPGGSPSMRPATLVVSPGGSHSMRPATLAVSPGKQKLTFERAALFQGEPQLQRLPNIERWADDGHYFEIRANQVVKVDAVSGSSVLVLNADDQPALKKEGWSIADAEDHSPDWQRLVFLKETKLFLFSQSNGQLKCISDQASEVKNPAFSFDGRLIAYTTAGNLLVYDIAAEKTSRLTRDGSDDILNGYASWIYYEEILGRPSHYRAFWWSPDSRRLAFMRFDQSRVPIFPIFNAHGAYGELERQRYPKPGYPNPAVRLGIAAVDGTPVDWVPLDESPDHYLGKPLWNKTGNRLYVPWLNRGQDHLKIYAYDRARRRLEVRYQETQPHFINFLEEGDWEILDDERVLVRSARDGWYHLYLAEADGRLRPTTSGQWQVEGIDHVGGRRNRVFFTARRGDTTRLELYSISLRGRDLKKISDFPGSHAATFSPSGDFFLDRYSNLTTPARLELRDAGGKLVRQLGDSCPANLKDFQLATVEKFRIKTDDGYELPAVWYLPADFDRSKKYPVLFSIYGSPGKQSVSDSFPRSWFNYYLAQEGIIVLVVDHRGSGHFGKKAVDLMHRQLGKWEMNDYIQAVKYLRQRPFIDSQRIGIEGSSYGGYLAALALTYAGDYFQFGIADSSVIDWSLYDSVYTERFMDSPQENPDGYRQSSVLTYTDGYRGGLRITHGAMDDNVHMQNTLQLVDKLLNEGKNVELMIFPSERHGYRGKKYPAYQRANRDFWFRHLLGKTSDR